LSVIELFRATITELIRANEDFNILSYVFHPPSLTLDLSSWISDFYFAHPPEFLSPRSHASVKPTSSAPPNFAFLTPTAFLPRVWHLGLITQLSVLSIPAHFDIFNQLAST
jgi:hypothetical protein